MDLHQQRKYDKFCDELSALWRLCIALGASGRDSMLSEEAKQFEELLEGLMDKYEAALTDYEL